MRVLLIDFNPFAPAVTPISLAYVGAVLRRHGHRVQVLSLGSDSCFSTDGFAAVVRSAEPDLLGLGAYQRNLHHLRAIARLVRQVRPQCRVVLGGPQAMFMPEQALLQLPEVDFLCRGEGETAIETIIEAIEAGDQDRAINGVTRRRRSGEPVTGPAAAATTDLDAYPSPWLDGVLDPAQWQEAVLLSSRGCPFDCSFCITPAASSRRCRQHSVERVVAEISHVAEHGSGRLWFADPNFCCKPTRVMEILEAVLQRGLQLSMWLETRADMINDELITLMRRAGVHTVAMGLESASTSVTPVLNKLVQPERVAEAARAVLAAGMQVELFSQFALPGESLDDAFATLRFVKDCGVPIRGNSNAQQMQLYFGSAINDAPEEYGIRTLREPRPTSRWARTSRPRA